MEVILDWILGTHTVIVEESQYQEVNCIVPLLVTDVLYRTLLLLLAPTGPGIQTGAPGSGKCGRSSGSSRGNGGRCGRACGNSSRL